MRIAYFSGKHVLGMGIDKDKRYAVQFRGHSNATSILKGHAMRNLKEDKLYMGNDSGFYDYDVVTLKNYLANFYNIPRANIYINIYDGQDNKEGIEN